MSTETDSDLLYALEADDTYPTIVAEVRALRAALARVIERLANLKARAGDNTSHPDWGHGVRYAVQVIEAGLAVLLPLGTPTPDEAHIDAQGRRYDFTEIAGESDHVQLTITKLDGEQISYRVRNKPLPLSAGTDTTTDQEPTGQPSTYHQDMSRDPMKRDRNQDDGRHTP